MADRFRRSFTDGWIDFQLKETKEGDLQGLRKIIDFPETGRSDLVHAFDSDGEDLDGDDYDCA